MEHPFKWRAPEWETEDELQEENNSESNNCNNKKKILRNICFL